MSGITIVCAILAACAAPEPSAPANQAPPPRAVKPDVSLVLVEEYRLEDGSFRTGVWQIGFRNGKELSAEIVWECDGKDSPYFDKAEIRANRYVVSMRGSVLDLRERKLINAEREGEVTRIDDTKVTYWIDSKKRDSGLFAFEYTTGTLTRVEKLKEPRIPFRAPRSPDGLKALNWVDEELLLHRDGEKPKSLGTGFKTDRVTGVRTGSGFSTFPMLWLDDNRILTQRETGKLVTVDLDGKVADVVTIKGLPKEGSSGLFRDHTGSVVYYVGDKNFAIDPAKKTITPSDWGGLGHGFEMTWEFGADDQFKFRHNGKDIGRVDCWPYEALSAPGAIATPMKNRTMIAVWCGSAWEALSFTRHPTVVGWIK